MCIRDSAYVARQCPTKRQTLLFSATYPEGIARLAQNFLRNPQEVKLLEQHEGSKIRQRFYEVIHQERLQAVALLLKHYRPVSTLAFCNTKQQCRDLLNVLRHEGIQALTLNGDLEQRERDQVLIQFANRSCTVLVATDVAARGLDIANLEAVINVDVTPDPEIHIHRIGRTGRGDEEGWALSLCSHGDKRRVAAIAEAMNCSLTWSELGALDATDNSPLVPPMVTLQILGGRKDKIRPVSYTHLDVYKRQEEEDLLDKAWGLQPNSRLGCQAIVGTTPLVVEIPKYSINMAKEGHRK